MKKSKVKRIILWGILSVIIVFLVLSVSLLLYIGYVMTGEPPWFSRRHVVNGFWDDKEILVVVRDYLAESCYDNILIWTNPDNMEEGTMSVAHGRYRIQINDSEVVNAVAELRYRRYSVIGRSENAIRFVRWSTMDAARGIVYSLDGSVPGEDALTFLTRIEPLGVDGWFYFEDDFNAWRERNR